MRTGTSGLSEHITGTSLYSRHHYNMWMFSGKCTSQARLVGKTAVVTGCNTGIGKITVADFMRRGARVIMACRDVEKAETAAEEIRKETHGVAGVGVVAVVRLDLSSFVSIRECAARLLRTEPQINLLVNNAGIMACPRALTEDGFESQFGVNHLGHFLFTLLLLPRILNSTPARIVTVSSLAHTGGNINFEDINSEKGYSPLGAYKQSKLANVLFSKELSNRLQGRGVTTYSLHPGMVKTELGRHMNYFPGFRWLMQNTVSPLLKSPEQGAQTTIYCAVAEETAEETGLYYSDCKKKVPSARARDAALALRLWDESVKWVGLKDFDPFTAEDRPPAAHTKQTTS